MTDILGIKHKLKGEQFNEWINKQYNINNIKKS